MEKRFLFALMAVWCTNAYTQTFAVSFDRFSMALVGIENPITIVVQDVPCENLLLAIDNGKVVRSSTSNCSFVLIPQNVGIANLTIQSISNGDTTHVGSKKIFAKGWETPDAQLGCRHKSGSISRGMFMAQGGICAPITAYDISGTFEVVSYSIRWVRNGECYREANNLGARFTQVNQKEINEVRPGDSIHFYDIYSRMPGERRPIKLNDLFFNIIP